jgi:hypothetical protein
MWPASGVGPAVGRRNNCGEGKGSELASGDDAEKDGKWAM